MSTSEKIFNYTDDHDVDEDKTTVSLHAGRWNRSTLTGIVCRNLYDTPTITGGDVASLKKNK